MAMVECRECGKSVSGEAKICPNCGINAPNPEIHELLDMAEGFGVKASDFDSYDADRIRERVHENLEELGMQAALEEKGRQDAHRKKTRFWLFYGALIVLAILGYFADSMKF